MHEFALNGTSVLLDGNPMLELDESSFADMHMSCDFQIGSEYCLTSSAPDLRAFLYKEHQLSLITATCQPHFNAKGSAHLEARDIH
jgi:hypothetical protein